MDCFFPITHVCTMRYLFFPLQHTLKSNNLPTCHTTPKACQHFAKHDSFIMSVRRKRKREGIVSGYPSSVSCVFLSELARSAGGGNAGLRLGCQSKLWWLSHVVAWFTACSHCLCCPGQSLASTIATRETGVEDRKCGFLWFYSTMSGLGSCRPLSCDIRTLRGICFY